MTHTLIAWIVLGVFALVSLFGNVEISGSYIRNPIIKMVVGPIIILIAGALMLIFGALMASPILLFVF